MTVSTKLAKTGTKTNLSSAQWFTYSLGLITENLQGEEVGQKGGNGKQVVCGITCLNIQHQAETNIAHYPHCFKFQVSVLDCAELRVYWLEKRPWMRQPYVL
jgi:hypothetical protein